MVQKFTPEQQLVGVHMLRPLTEEQRRDESVRRMAGVLVRLFPDEQVAVTMFQSMTSEYLADQKVFPSAPPETQS